MEGLFKLIFYIIIIAFWAISNIKKQGKWEEKIPDFPKEPSKPKRNQASYKPGYQKPHREGYSAQKSQPTKKEKVPSPSMTFDELLALRRQQTLKGRQSKKVKKSEPEPRPESLPSTIKEEKAKELKPQIMPPRLKIEQKPALSLNSSIKEGIIWSVILGPPRSKKQFDWKNPSTRR